MKMKMKKKWIENLVFVWMIRTIVVFLLLINEIMKCEKQTHKYIE